jgi:hypothetical protein
VIAFSVILPNKKVFLICGRVFQQKSNKDIISNSLLLAEAKSQKKEFPKENG